MPSPSEAPSGGAQPFASFLAFEKGSRRKGETIGGRYRSNGYVRRQPISHRASCDAPASTLRTAQLMRRQWNAERPWRHSHAERGNDQCAAAFASRLAPTGDPGAPVKVRSALRPPRFAVDRGRPTEQCLRSGSGVKRNPKPPLPQQWTCTPTTSARADAQHTRPSPN
jgi:hypothetical protein